jgi:hypothetical protein
MKLQQLVTTGKVNNHFCVYTVCVQTYLFNFTSGKRKSQWQRIAVSNRWLIWITGLKMIAMLCAFILLYFSWKILITYILSSGLNKKCYTEKEITLKYIGRNSQY